MEDSAGEDRTRPLTGLSPFTPLELQDAGVAAEGAEPPEMPPAIPIALGPVWNGGTTYAPQCTVPNATSFLVRRYHTRHQNHQRYHYHHAPAS